MTNRNNNDIKKEHIPDPSVICCMPCICCFITGEKLLQGICIGMLGLLSCGCIPTPTTIPRSEEGDIELCNLEETKDAL